MSRTRHRLIDLVHYYYLDLVFCGVSLHLCCDSWKTSLAPLIFGYCYNVIWLMHQVTRTGKLPIDTGRHYLSYLSESLVSTANEPENRKVIKALELAIESPHSKAMELLHNTLPR